MENNHPKQPESQEGLVVLVGVEGWGPTLAINDQTDQSGFSDI